MTADSARSASHRLSARELFGDVPEFPSSLRLAPDADGIVDLLHDESKVAAPGVASVAVPESLAELRQVMRWHAQRGNHVWVSGMRTGLAGGAVPDEQSHLVSLSVLRGEIVVRDGGVEPTATMLAGTWLSELNAHLAARGDALVFPVDPTETSASLGGMVATNASGARSYRFGAMREWVMGLTVELASGRTLKLRRGEQCADGHTFILRDGAAVRTVVMDTIPKPATKNSIGYAFVPDGDAVDLFIGAEGTLGIVSEVEVRLFRQHEHRMGFLQFFAAIESAFAFVNALRADHALRTTAIEFLDARSHALAAESGKPEVERVLRLAERAAASVFTEIAYDGDEELASVAERLESLAQASGGDPHASLAGATENELRDIRAFRHAVPERINAIIAERRSRFPELHKLATDMAVTDADLGWVHELYRSSLTGAGLDFAIFGHAGNNHFHVNILPRDPDELATAKAIYADFARVIVERGGCVAAEHGIGRIKKSFLELQYPASVLETMRAIKTWADPAWRLNDGVLLGP